MSLLLSILDLFQRLISLLLLLEELSLNIRGVLRLDLVLDDKLVLQRAAAARALVARVETSRDHEGAKQLRGMQIHHDARVVVDAVGDRQRQPDALVPD